MAYKMKGFGGFKPSPAKVKKTPRLKAEKLPVYSKDSGLDTTKPGNKEKTDDYIVNSSKAYNKDNPRPNMENLPKGSVFVGGVSKKSPAKMQKKIKKVSFKPSLSKPKSDGLVPMGKGGTMNHIKSLQKMEKQAKTGKEKAKIRESIATAREEYNKPIYNQEKSSPAKKRGLWDNIHAKRKRGETMRKKGAKGAPTEQAIKDSQ